MCLPGKGWLRKEGGNHVFSFPQINSTTLALVFTLFSPALLGCSLVQMT